MLIFLHCKLQWKTKIWGFPIIDPLKEIIAPSIMAYLLLGVYIIRYAKQRGVNGLD